MKTQKYQNLINEVQRRAIKEMQRGCRNVCVSRSNVAPYLGVSPATWDDLVSGLGSPTLKTLGKLSNRVGLDISIIYQDAEG